MEEYIKVLSSKQKLIDNSIKNKIQKENNSRILDEYSRVIINASQNSDDLQKKLTDEFVNKDAILTYLRNGKKYSVTIKPEELK